MAVRSRRRRRVSFWSQEHLRNLYAYWDHEGICFRCSGPLAIASMVLVELRHCTAAICGRCARAGGASRIRALYAGTRKKGNGMIDRESYPGASRPALKPDSIGYPKTTAAVLTIADVDPEVEIPEDNGGTRKVLTVIFKEFPDLVFYTNKTSREALIERLGLNEKNWTGERVPLVVVTTNNPRTKKPQPSLWVADPKEWDGHLKRGSRRGRR
jgi:hypothetical protein